jgi:alpha-D-ribose 1-methylphosphonate 5-triphosphate diphosphatase
VSEEYRSDLDVVLIDGATVVLPDRIIAGGAVRIAGDRIAEVAESRAEIHGGYDRTIDAHGAYLMPGVIDLHNDSLETEINPRPETDLPLEFALTNMERRLLPFGVTTEFHAMAFMNMARNRRTIQATAIRTEYIAGHRCSGRALIDHQVLHRLDVWSPDSMDAIFESVDQFPVRYISLNDHTPGQGQYRDLEKYIDRMVAWTAARGGAPPDANEIHTRIATRNADTTTIPNVYSRVRLESDRMPLVIASHDDDSAAKVDMLWELGARVAEFPITIDAARRARDRGMWIVVGAPNIVRGGSSSGNQDARELFELGLADIICADYHAPSLLRSAFRLLADGLTDLPGAIRSLTYNPARAVGLTDVGAVREGHRADLILVRCDADAMPVVESVYRDGREVYTLNTPQPAGVAS